MRSSSMLLTLVAATVVATANAATIDNTLPANNQATLTAEAGQTFTINVPGLVNAVGSPLFGQKLASIEIEGPQTTNGSDPMGPFTLEVWTDGDNDPGTWATGTLVATSTNSGSFVAGGATLTTFNFSNQPLAPGRVYAFTYTDGAGNRLPARVGLTNANAISDGSVFSAGATPFSDAFDTAMRINANESIVLDHINLPNLTTTGSQSTFEYQTFTPSIAGAGTTDTVAAHTPLTPVVALETLSFVRAPAGTATAGSLYLDIYSGGAGDVGTFIGSSLNAVDINGSDFLSVLNWEFSNLLLDSDAEYSIVFSTNFGAGGTASGRVAAANNGAGFIDTYAGGIARGPNDFVVPFDTLFAATFVSVPEPGTWALLLTAAGVALIGVRRRRGR